MIAGEMQAVSGTFACLRRLKELEKGFVLDGVCLNHLANNDTDRTFPSLNIGNVYIDLPLKLCRLEGIITKQHIPLKAYNFKLHKLTLSLDFPPSLELSPSLPPSLSLSLSPSLPVEWYR